MTSRPTIYADFANADPAGRVRLNTVGSTAALDGLAEGPVDGMEVNLESEELAVPGVLRFSSDEKIWVAHINWDAVSEKLRHS